MLLDESKGFADLTPRKTGMLCKLNGRLKPELGFAVLPLHMDVNSRLLSRKEIEPKSAFPK